MCSELVAHLLDLRGLRFEDGTEGLNLFLLGCDGRVELLLLLHNGRLLPLINLGLFFHLTVFFEELVEQHHLYRFFLPSMHGQDSVVTGHAAGEITHSHGEERPVVSCCCRWSRI